MDNCENSDWLAYHKDQLLMDLPDDSDYPIYRGEEDLEAVQKSNAAMVAVVSADSPVIICVPREKFRDGAISLNASDLFDLANLL